jgi:O-antigen ligase
LLLPFLACAAANAAWVSPVPWLGWSDWLGWAQAIAVFWVVLNGIRSPAPQRALLLALVALGITGVLMACYQRFVRPEWAMLGFTQRLQFLGRASGCFGTPNTFAAFLLLLLPITGALMVRRTATATERVWWGWITVVLVLGLGLTISRGAWIGLALALTAWPLSNSRWSWKRRALGGAVMLLVIVAASATVVSATPKIRQRFADLVASAGERSRPIMWRAAWRLFCERPFCGTGAGSYDVLFEKYRTEEFLDDPQWAHNDYLNTLSDYGAVGFGLLFGASAVVIGACLCSRRSTGTVRRSDWLESLSVRHGVAIGLLAFATQLMIDFHLKVPALALTCATIAGMFVGRAWPAAENSPVANSAWPRFASLAMALAVIAGAAWALPSLRGEALRNRARESIDRLAELSAEPASRLYREHLGEARPLLRRAVELAPANGQAWADLAYATELWGYVEPARAAELGREAEAAAEQALARSRVVYEFWIRRGVARDLQARWFEAGADFAEALKLAPTNAYAWYYYAHHLSLRSTERAMTDAALAFCLRLDPGNRAGLTLRQRLAIRPPTAP